MDKNNKSITEIFEEENSKEQARLECIAKYIAAGVTFIDWKNAYIEETVTIAPGTVIYPGVILRGTTIIGKDCMIGQNTRIENSTIGEGVSIQSSVILDSMVDDCANIGPFAYLRPGSKIGKYAKVGDFVEVKNSKIGDHSKASHLTYVGDSDVGESVNLGCGVVFVNYDGKNKHRSIVGDGAFVGCNTNLVSPVCVGEGAYIAAGSTVTADIPKGALCVARAKQRNIEGWVKKRGLLKGRE